VYSRKAEKGLPGDRRGTMRGTPVFGVCGKVMVREKEYPRLFHPGIVRECTPKRRGNIMNFHAIMARSFLGKANRIEHNLTLLKKEERTQKSIEDITKIQNRFERIKEVYIPRIKTATGYEFLNPDLFFFVFLYKEIAMVFNEAQTNPVKPGGIELLSSQDLREMVEVSEDTKTLAYIGDAALETGVMASIWSLEETRKIPLNEFLHKERSNLVENEPLSRFWDSLLLEDSSFIANAPPENNETKGSSMEAVFGIIFLENGVEAVETALQNLKKYYERKK
jgi:23S rRNA maturation mini-RNase III